MHIGVIKSQFLFCSKKISVFVIWDCINPCSLSTPTSEIGTRKAPEAERMTLGAYTSPEESVYEDFLFLFLAQII